MPIIEVGKVYRKKVKPGEMPMVHEYPTYGQTGWMFDGEAWNEMLFSLEKGWVTKVEFCYLSEQRKEYNRKRFSLLPAEVRQQIIRPRARNESLFLHI